jgi:two-component sensor histidine kinase
LALALLPWLLITGFEALSKLDRNRITQSELSDLVAANLVREVGRTLDAGRLGLDAAPQIIAEYGCEAGSLNILNRLRPFEAFIVKSSDNEVICQSPEFIDTLVLINPDAFTETRLFRLERGRLEEDDTSRSVVVMQSQVRSSGYTYTLVFPIDADIGVTMEAGLGSDARLALTKPDGRSILGMESGAQQNADYRANIGTDDAESFLDIVDEQGRDRRVASQYFSVSDVYVSVGRPADSGPFQTFINPYTSVFLPVLAWFVGFGLILLGTQSMLLTPIAKIRRAALQFAKGRMASRVSLTDAAAAEVMGLANSFNTMAEMLEERSKKIDDNLDEKDTLMREIHHRVKNNLQIIISLLNMQERKATTEEAMAAIAETRTRINAIAIVHRGLYESQDLRRIDMADFIDRLIGAIGDSLDTHQSDISLHHKVANCQMTADSAIPVALFIVEAISNAAQHGVDRGGDILVEIARAEDNQITVRVCDNGRGMGDPSQMRGIGSKLMRGFARQLSGTLSFRDNRPGLIAELSFQFDDSDEQPFQVRRQSA